MSAPDPTPGDTGPPEVPQTGVSVVDDVLASLEGVDQQPLDDRVGTFEDAQRDLRRALDDPSDGPSGG